MIFLLFLLEPTEFIKPQPKKKKKSGWAKKKKQTIYRMSKEEQYYLSHLQLLKLPLRFNQLNNIEKMLSASLR